MPTKNPRLSVVLTPSLAATLGALSVETGDSASSIVRDLLTQTEPALRRMLELVRAAKVSRGQIGAGLSESMRRVIDDLEDSLAVAYSRQERVTRDLLETAEEVKGRRRGAAPDAVGGRRPTRAAEPSTPVPVTRGSGSGKTRKGGVRGGSL